MDSDGTDTRKPAIHGKGDRVFRPSVYAFLSLIVIVISGRLKQNWTFSYGTKELHAKHYTLLTGLHGYLAYTGSDSYTSKETDIFVTTFGRSGTMMLMHMVHQLRVNGSFDFDHVENLGGHFVPFIGLGRLIPNPSVDEHPPLAIYWSHAMPFQLPTAPRYIYVQRRPQDVVLSFWHFARQFYTLEGELSLEDFYHTCIRKHCFWPENSLFNHVASWFQYRRDNPDRFLWLYFENITKNPGKTLRQIVKFLGDPQLSGASVEHVEEFVKLSAVLKHKRKFGMADIQDSSRVIINYLLNNPDFEVGESGIIKSVTQLKKQCELCETKLKSEVELCTENQHFPEVGKTGSCPKIGAKAKTFNFKWDMSAEPTNPEQLSTGKSQLSTLARQHSTIATQRSTLCRKLCTTIRTVPSPGLLHAMAIGWHKFVYPVTGYRDHTEMVLREDGLGFMCGGVGKGN